MERIKRNRTASLILCSDIHLRDDAPKCFIGNFEEEQWLAITYVAELQKKHGCVVLHAGDLFHHWKPSPWLLSRAIELLPKMFITVYGQHDLPQHNMELSHKSGMNTLLQAGKVTILRDGSWGWEPKGGRGIIVKDKEILAWHHMTYLTKPFPGAEGGMAEGILRKYPQYDLIVTGDNHQSFTIEYKGRRLVNPGSLTRQTASQIDFKPRVALWYAEDNSIEWVYMPIQKDAITREHIEVKEQRDARITAFVSSLKDDYEKTLSFEDNLEQHFATNHIRKEVKEIIYKSLEK